MLGDIMLSVRDELASAPALSELQEGDLAALGQIYDQHHVAVRLFARRMLDEAAAEDLVHDTFLTLPKALRRWNGEGSLRTFIIGIAVNHARHHARSQARRRLAMLRFAREPARPTRTQEDVSDQRRLAELLRCALGKLSFDHRSVFVLCDVEERSSPEVARILAVPEATVRTRLYHARLKLRAALEKEGVR
jgi:RNA polymerase sigma-70 factor (ECF subfamily)